MLKEINDEWRSEFLHNSSDCSNQGVMTTRTPRQMMTLEKSEGENDERFVWISLPLDANTNEFSFRSSEEGIKSFCRLRTLRVCMRKWKKFFFCFPLSNVFFNIIDGLTCKGIINNREMCAMFEKKKLVYYSGGGKRLKVFYTNLKDIFDETSWLFPRNTLEWNFTFIFVLQEFYFFR